MPPASCMSCSKTRPVPLALVMMATCGDLGGTNGDIEMSVYPLPFSCRADNFRTTHWTHLPLASMVNCCLHPLLAVHVSSKVQTLSHCKQRDPRRPMRLHCDQPCQPKGPKSNSSSPTHSALLTHQTSSMSWKICQERLARQRLLHAHRIQRERLWLLSETADVTTRNARSQAKFL